MSDMSIEEEHVSEDEVHSFLEAARTGQWVSVEAWLMLGPARSARVNDMPDGAWSALHHAASLRSAEAARMLLRYGADQSLRDRDGQTAADVARNCGGSSVERLLRHAEMDGEGATSLGGEAFFRGVGVLRVIVGNTATPVRWGLLKRWEWQVFVNCQSASQMPMIRSVFMGLHETFVPNVTELKRNPARGGFISDKINGWGAFEVQLHIYIQGIQEPTAVKHFLNFDQGGSSSTIDIDIDGMREKKGLTETTSGASSGLVRVGPTNESTIPRNHTAEVAAMWSHSVGGPIDLNESDAQGELTKQNYRPHPGTAYAATRSMSFDGGPIDFNESNAQREHSAGTGPAVAAMKLELAKEWAKQKQKKSIAAAAAAIGARKFGKKASPELDAIVGNAARPVPRRKNLWEWTIFLRPLQSRPPLSVSIDRVVMELHESFRDPIQQLNRGEYGQFVSKRMVGWGTFQVALRVHIRGITAPVIVRHDLSFEGGGSSSEITMIPDATGNERVRQIRSVDVSSSNAVAMDHSPPQRQSPKKDSLSSLFKTRTSLEAAINRHKNDIDAVRSGNKMNMEVLQKAERAQSELDLLIPLREKLPSFEELNDQISELETQRDKSVGDGDFIMAMELQHKIDELGLKRRTEEEEDAVKRGRSLMKRVINDDLDPEPIPHEYLEDCTGDFSDDKRLGEGAFSEVFLGKDKVLRRKFAVKRLRVSLHADADIAQARRTFEREVMTLTHFHHPNIARLYAYYLSPDLTGNQCLVFELAAKGSLWSFLTQREEREKLHWATRINIALDVSNALSFLHNGTSGQVCYHRDVKSANICLRRDFHALLIDTGVSKMMPEHESDSTMTIMETTGAGLRGTRGYICPYFARSTRGYNSASEVFSLGIVFAELFTGILQNGLLDGEEVDHFDWFSRDGMLYRQLDKYGDASAGGWPADLRQKFAQLAVEMIQMRPGERPKIQDVIRELRTLASQARPWSPGERNQIKVLSSAPLVWANEDGSLNAITSSLDFAVERDVLAQCIGESKRDIKLTFDVATDDRLLAAATSRCGCLHFSGHGAPNFLVLEDGTGGAHFLGSSELYDRVHKEPFKFVFVSACYSGLMGRAFVEAGVPHVVCCDHDEELRDDAALKFAHSFYFALAEGFTIQAAYEKGRQAVSKRFGRQEENKFLLLPEDVDHEKPLFDAEILEWEDDDHGEKFIPAPPQDFVGRETDMYLLLHAILSNQLVTLVGVEGVGCSSLASAVSHYIDERKTSMLCIHDIYFVRESRGRNTLLESFFLPLQQLLLSEGKMSEPQEELLSVLGVCQNICKALSGTKALIVFDGADAEDRTFVDAVKFILANTSSVKLLVTSNVPISSWLPDIDEHVFRLDPLSAESTAILFGKMCPYTNSPQKRRALRDVFVEKNGLSLLQEKAFLSRFGGGIPSNVIRAAKTMTRDEYKTFCRPETGDM